MLQLIASRRRQARRRQDTVHPDRIRSGRVRTAATRRRLPTAGPGRLPDLSRGCRELEGRGSPPRDDGKTQELPQNENPLRRLHAPLRLPLPVPSQGSGQSPLANTGVLLFITGEDAIWPKALEVQGKHAEIGSIRPNGGAAEVVVRETDGVRTSATHPVGEWNAIEVVARGGALTVLINGQKLLESDAGELKSGAIGFQAEGHAVEFRNVRTQSAPAAAPVPAP